MNTGDFAVLVGCALLGACGATHQSATVTTNGGASGSAGTPIKAGAGDGANPSAGASNASDGGAVGVDAGGSTECDPSKPTAAPLAMLDGERHQEALRSALGAAAASYVKLPLPTASGMPLNVDTISALHEDAHLLALELTASPKAMAALIGCTEADGAAACRDSFIQSFGARAFRRPLTDDDTADLRAWFDTGAKLGGDFASGVRAVVEVTLQSPDFLYAAGANTCGSSAP